MGLDVYLYHYKDFNKSKELEKEYETKSDELWEKLFSGKSYSDLSDAQKTKYEKACAKLAKQVGSEKFNADNVKEIEIDSKIDDEHMFKVGYFRSSYNDAGFNSVLRRTIDKSLYEIFDKPEGKYEFSPNWKESRDRALAALEEFNTFIGKSEGFAVMDFDQHSFLPKEELQITPKQVLENFLTKFNQAKGRKSPFGDGNRDWFGCKDGEFFLGEPLQVYCIYNGYKEFLGKPTPTTFVVYKQESEKESQYSWYRTALEIVVETCDYVLSQPDPENYYFHWSS